MEVTVPLKPAASESIFAIRTGPLFSGSSPHISLGLQGHQGRSSLMHSVCGAVCTGFNGQYSVDTSDRHTVGAISACHSSLAIQQLPLNFIWIQLLNPTSKYNHNGTLRKVNKKCYCSCQGQKKSLSANIMHSSLITAPHDSVPTKGSFLLLIESTSTSFALASPHSPTV